MKKIICASYDNMDLCLSYLLKTKIRNDVNCVDFLHDGVVVVTMLDGNIYWFETE